MSETDIIDITRLALITSMKLGGPLLLVAMVIGLLVSLFQALTSIQEMTLTFVPKIICIMLALFFFSPFMLQVLKDFSYHLFDLIVQYG